MPALFLCYFIPGLLGSAGVYGINDHNVLYKPLGSRVLLPAILVLLASAADIPEILKLGTKALCMFFATTIGVVAGGPLAVWLMGLIHKPAIAGDGVWRGLSYVAGGWIGGGSNSNAMIEIFDPPAANLSQSIALDVIWGNLWMAGMLFLVGRKERVDAWLRADNEAVEALRLKMAAFQAQSNSTAYSIVL